MTNTEILGDEEQQYGNVRVFRAFLFVAASICAFAHVWMDILTIGFRDNESNHLLLVPFVAIWVAYCRGSQLQHITGKGQLWGLVLIFWAWGLHEVGLRSNLLMLWHASAVVCLLGGLIMSFGLAFIYRFLPVVTILLAMIPVPGLIRQEISRPLQFYSASATQWIVSSLGATVEQSGCILSVNGVHVAISEACSGMRMIFAIMLVTYALCFSMQLRKRVRLALLMTGPLIAILLNTIRLVTTVAIYSLASAEIGQTFHDMSAWLFPLIYFAVVVWFIGTPSDDDLQWKHLAGISWQRSHITSAFGSAVLLITIVVNSYMPPSYQEVTRHQFAVHTLMKSTPYAIGDWVAVDHELTHEDVELLDPIAQLRRRYKNINTGKRITLTAVASRRARNMVGHEPGICFQRQGWTKIHQSPVKWNVSKTGLYGRYYEFTMPHNSILLHNKVTSILVTPGGVTSGDTHSVAEAASDIRREPFGALAIQLQSINSFDNDEWHEVSSEFVSAFKDMVRQYGNCVTL